MKNIFKTKTYIFLNHEYMTKLKFECTVLHDVRRNNMINTDCINNKIMNDTHTLKIVKIYQLMETHYPLENIQFIQFQEKMNGKFFLIIMLIILEFLGQVNPAIFCLLKFLL